MKIKIKILNLIKYIYFKKIEFKNYKIYNFFIKKYDS